jgi:hypothetical protein
VAFLAVDFLAVAFLAVAFLAVDFFAVAFLAVAFAAVDFVAVAFVAGAFFVALSAVAFLVGVFSSFSLTMVLPHDDVASARIAGADSARESRWPSMSSARCRGSGIIRASVATPTLTVPT